MTKKTIITVLLTLLTMSATSQGTGAMVDSNPGWLWEISGNGLAQKSYLFGWSYSLVQQLSIQM